MPTVSLADGAVVASRTCVVCGATGATELYPVVFRQPRRGAIGAGVFGVFGVIAFHAPPRVLDLPFDPECHARWRRGQAFAVFAGIASFITFFAGLLIKLVGSEHGDPTMGTGVVIFGLFLLVHYAAKGPRCVLMKPDATIIDVPSDNAAEAIRSGTPERTLSFIDFAQQFPNKPVAAGTLCAKHASVPACFGCARCGAAGCRDCEFRVGSPSVLLCGACLRVVTGAR